MICVGKEREQEKIITLFTILGRGNTMQYNNIEMEIEKY